MGDVQHVTLHGHRVRYRLDGDGDETLLLIHGMADNNTGTFPIQSERMFAALKGNGGTARYIQLPAESHGYAARESVGHTLFEMLNWLDQYVKPSRPRM